VSRSKAYRGAVEPSPQAAPAIKFCMVASSVVVKKLDECQSDTDRKRAMTRGTPTFLARPCRPKLWFVLFCFFFSSSHPEAHQPTRDGRYSCG
jgi:hypothetical protein